MIGTSGDRGTHSLTIDNSNLKDAQISLNREDDSSKDFTTTISNSEISMFLRANGLKAVRNSIIANGDFNQIDEINDSVCESVLLDGKVNKILNGYNSEIEGNFVCDSVKEISASYLENVKLESLDRVESCYLSAYIYENDGKRSNLINVNSNEEKILPKDTKLEIL